MSRRIQELAWAFIIAAGAATVGGPADAQIVSKNAPSLSVPNDLTRPLFDTGTPSYRTTNLQAKSADTVVADVDGRAVTLGDVADAIKALPPSVNALPFNELFPRVLDKLVREQALIISGYQLGLDEDPAIRRKIKAATDSVMANEVLHHQIARTITEQALLDQYQKDFAGQPGADEVHARVIMVRSKAAAMEIIAKLQAGADFAALAKAASQDTTAPLGGDLGYVRLDGLNAEVGAVAFSLAPGTFSAFPVQSGDSYFVVRVEDRRQQPTPTFTAARPLLVQTLLRDGVPDAVAHAMAAVSVRKFTIAGKEISGSAATP